MAVAVKHRYLCVSKGKQTADICVSLKASKQPIFEYEKSGISAVVALV